MSAFKPASVLLLSYV